MRRSTAARPVLPADWMEVLGRVLQTLEQAEAAAAQRAAALAPAADDANGAPPWRQQLGQVRERVDGLALYADRAGRDVAEVDAALGAGEDTLRQWLAANEAARRRLAEWVGRAVG